MVTAVVIAPEGDEAAGELEKAPRRTTKMMKDVEWLLHEDTKKSRAVQLRIEMTKEGCDRGPQNHEWCGRK